MVDKFLFEGRMVLLQPWLFIFATAFITVLLGTYVYKRNAKKGKMDWQKYQKATLKFRVVLVLGAVIVPIGLYALAKDVGVLEMFLGERVNFVSDLIATVIFFFFGPGFLGAGLGFELESLIFPIKNPQQTNKFPIAEPVKI